MVEYVKGGEGADPERGEKQPESKEIQRYKEILSREPSSLVFAALAEAYRRMDFFDQAIAVCRKGLRHHPGFVSGRVALARAFMDAGQSQAAQKELETVVRAVPENLAAQKLLAKIYRQQSDTDRLEKTLHRILALDVSDTGAKEELDRLNERKTAQGSADHSENPGRDRQIVTRTLAELYASQGCYDKAFEIYRELSSRKPDSPLFHERLADLKEKILQRSVRVKPKEEREDEAR